MKSGFVRLKDGWRIAKMPKGVHDTFQVDDKGNMSEHHTTVQIPGGQKKNIFLDKK